MQFIYPNESAQYIYPVLPSGGGSSTEFTTEFRTLTVGEAAAKALTLANIPDTATEVVVMPVGGSTQFYGVDYTVFGNILDWNGLGLDTIGLVAGDELVILYKV